MEGLKSRLACTDQSSCSEGWKGRLYVTHNPVSRLSHQVFAVFGVFGEGRSTCHDHCS